MPNLNIVMLMGHLVRDVELKTTQGGSTFGKFTVATTYKFKAKDGTSKEDTAFVDCTSFGKQAEVIQKYFKKGSPIFVQGRIKQENWEAQDGTKRSKLGVFVDKFEFVGGDRNAGTSSQKASDTPEVHEDDVPF